MQPSSQDFFNDLMARVSVPVSINTLAIVTSLAGQIEAWLRVLSLLAAITYTTVLIVKAVRKKN